MAGRSYKLQYKDDLADTNWNDAPPDVTATGAEGCGGSVLRTARCNGSIVWSSNPEEMLMRFRLACTGIDSETRYFPHVRRSVIGRRIVPYSTESCLF